MPTDFWRSAAAYGTWFVVGLPYILELATGAREPGAMVPWLAAFLGFGLALTTNLGCIRAAWRAPWGVLVLAIQSACGLVMVWTSQDGTSGAMLVIVAAMAASMLPAWGVGLWIGVQGVLLTLTWASIGTVVQAIALGGAFTGFQAFAASTVALARREREAREQLARVHAELLAARSLLAESSRATERVRIARELHDALGHHLTALSLQLEVAARLATEPASRHLAQAHAIARLLLSDVRHVVGEMRDSGLNLREALDALAAAPGGVRVHLDVPSSLEVDDGAQAQALLRSVQEIITNTSRHAAAQNLWIRLAPAPDGVILHARDDGRGAADVAWGNGLKGMHERFTEQAGRLEVESAPGRGFEVRGFMPRSAAPS